MKYLKLFEEMNIESKEFAFNGHDLSQREERILIDLVGDFLKKFNIKVEDHYYYTRIILSTPYYNRFDDFNELKDYILSHFHMYDSKPEEYLELLKTSNIDPSFDNNFSIRWASEGGHTKISEHLLNYPRVDPNCYDGLPIRLACSNGHTEIFKLLLNDPRVDPSLDENSCIWWARHKRCKEMVKLLLNDERVRSKLTEEEINRYTRYTNETS